MGASSCFFNCRNKNSRLEAAPTRAHGALLCYGSYAMDQDSTGRSPFHRGSARSNAEQRLE